MPGEQLYLSIATNRRGEKVPLFVHTDRAHLAALSHEWLAHRRAERYWMVGIEIQLISWASLAEIQPALVS
jgi:hypothetical protein